MALALLFWWPLFGGAGFIGGDVYSYYLPQKVVYAEDLAAHRLPLWNNRAGHGYPIVGESQTGPFYPFNLFLYSLLPINLAYNVNHLLHYLLAFAFTWLYARSLALSRWAAGLAHWSMCMAGFLRGRAGNGPSLAAPGCRPPSGVLKSFCPPACTRFAFGLCARADGAVIGGALQPRLLHANHARSLRRAPPGICQPRPAGRHAPAVEAGRGDCGDRRRVGFRLGGIAAWSDVGAETVEPAAGSRGGTQSGPRIDSALVLVADGRAVVLVLALHGPRRRAPQGGAGAGGEDQSGRGPSLFWTHPPDAGPRRGRPTLLEPRSRRA